MSEEKRPEWMTSVSANVNPEEYLLGRKIDKTFELSQREKAEKAKEARIRLVASDRLKLSGDPMLDLERRKDELKLEIISNPIKLKQFRDMLLREEKKQQQQGSPSSQTIETRLRPTRDSSRSPRRRDVTPSGKRSRSHKDSSSPEPHRRKSDRPYNDRERVESPRHTSREPVVEKEGSRHSHSHHHHHHHHNSRHDDRHSFRRHDSSERHHSSSSSRHHSHQHKSHSSHSRHSRHRDRKYE